MMKPLMCLAAALLLIGCASTTPTSQSMPVIDLSELSFTNPQSTDGRIVTGGQPTPEDLANLKAQGFGTVISLRTPQEDTGYDEAAVAADLGLTFVNIPVSTQSGLDAETAGVLRAALNQTKAPVLVHCGSGNRVGAIYAIGSHDIDGRTVEEALSVGRSHGLTGMEPTVRNILEGIEAD